MSGKGLDELVERTKRFESFKQRIAQKKSGLEGQLKTAVTTDGPLSEFRSVSISGFGKYPITFLLMICGSSYVNGKITKAFAFIESDPLQMILELVPVITVLSVMLVTGILVRSSAREILSESETTTSLT